MHSPLSDSLDVALAVVYLLVGVAAALQWVRGRDRNGGLLALTLVGFGAVTIVTAIIRDRPDHPMLGAIALVALILSGACFAAFRHSVIPYGRRTAGTMLGLIAIAVGAALVIQPDVSTERGGAVTARLASTLGVLVWSVCILEPCLRLWTDLRGLPAIQRNRALALLLGYSAALVLVLAGQLNQAIAQSSAGHAALDLTGILIAPVLWTGYMPPGPLRAWWRWRAEEELAPAVDSLIVGEQSRSEAAATGLARACALAAAGQGAVFDADGSVLALQGITSAEALLLMDGRPREGSSGRTSHLWRPRQNRTAVAITMPVHGGSGIVLLTGGPLMSILGDDERDLLERFVGRLGQALGRLSLTSALRDAERLAREADQHKTRMLHHLNHEVRNAMQPVIAYSELLLTRAQGVVDTTEAIRAIHQGGTLAARLLQDAVDLESVARGESPMDISDVSVRDAIAEARRLCARRAEESDVSITTRMDPDPDPWVRADPVRLSQILLNLIENAIKYNRPGGDVVIRVDPGMAAVTIHVQDTGEGVAADQMDMLFHPFVRLHQGPVRGSGIGLAHSRNLARAMGGDITAASTPGEGSTFSVSLPRGAPIVATARPDTAPRRQWIGAGRSRCVLVIDDDVASATTIAACCQMRPAITTRVEHEGNAGLRAALAERVDMVIADLQMPGLDGLEVLQRLRAAGEVMPFVLITAEMSRAVHQEVLNAGAQAVISKPFTLTGLLAVLDAWLPAPEQAVAPPPQHIRSLPRA